MSKKEKKQLQRIIYAGILFLLALPLHYRDTMLNLTGAGFFKSDIINYMEFPLFLISYIIIGGDIIMKAVRNIRRGQIFDENFLMTVATIGAFCLNEYAEGVAVMMFYQVGELFQSYAVSRSRRSIADLMDIRPDYANVVRNGVAVQVDPEEVRVGEEIVVKPGERIPLDGTVLIGHSAVDTSALTGESIPRDVEAGEAVISGCINQTGLLTIQVTKVFGESTVSKILELVENASDKKSKSENFITRFARYYTPIVVFTALILAVVPPLVMNQSFLIWVERALTFLVVSCPCALVISVPLSFFGGIGGASKLGVLVKGSNYLEMLSKTKTVVFDKTGTLTKGNFVVSEIKSKTMDSAQLLKLAAYVEDYSSHPIAVSIKKAYGKEVNQELVKDIEEIAGYGVKAIIEEKEVLAGNARLMKRFNIAYDQTDLIGTVIHIAVNNSYAGYILIADQIKEDSPRAMMELKSVGVKQTIMLTGDSEAVGRKVAQTLNLDKAYTELLPSDKVDKVEQLLEQRTSENDILAFVGDGINDAPVLARADVGIAMGGLGSDAAIEAADVVIMTDEPSKIAAVIKISKKTLTIVRQNIVFALAIKVFVLILSALGMASMWGAVFADVGVSILAILNAIRALNVKKLNTQGTAALTTVQNTH